MSTSIAPLAGKRRTNGKACIRCHDRKVKCDILEKQDRCSSCQAQGNTDCRLFERKKTRASSSRHGRHGKPQAAIAPATQGATRPRHTPSRAVDFTRSLTQSKSSRRSPSAGDSDASVTGDEGTATGNLADFIERKDIRSQEISKNARLYFIGTSFSNLHYLVRQGDPQSARNAFHFGSLRSAFRTPYVPPEALELPSKTLMADLLQAYFSQVNRGMPLVDEVEFMRRLRGGASDAMPPSLLLMNAVLGVGAHVVSTGKDESASLKSMFFRRAKILFDARYEEHREVYLQVALLFTWQCERPDDVVSNSWHWVGVAARTAFGMGMHRDASPSRLNMLDKRQWIRWWWILFQHDVLCSASHGRPQAICLEQSDTPMLQAAHFEGVPEAEVDFSIYHTQLCIIFSKAMQRRTAVRSTPADVAAATSQADKELAHLLTTLPDRLQVSWPEPDTWQAVLHLTYNSFLILLHRPSPDGGPDGYLSSASDLSICWDAVTTINSIFETLRSRDVLTALWLPSLHTLFTALVYVAGQVRSSNPVVVAKAVRIFDSLLLTLRGFAPHWLLARALLRLFDRQRVHGNNLQTAAYEQGSASSDAHASQPLGHRSALTTHVSAPFPSPSASDSAIHGLADISVGSAQVVPLNEHQQRFNDASWHSSQAGTGQGVAPGFGSRVALAPLDVSAPGGWQPGVASSDLAYGGETGGQSNHIDIDGSLEEWEMMADPIALEFLLAGMEHDYNY